MKKGEDVEKGSLVPGGEMKNKRKQENPAPE